MYFFHTKTPLTRWSRYFSGSGSHHISHVTHSFTSVKLSPYVICHNGYSVCKLYRENVFFLKEIWVYGGRVCSFKACGMQNVEYASLDLLCEEVISFDLVSLWGPNTGC